MTLADFEAVLGDCQQLDYFHDLLVTLMAEGREGEEGAVLFF